MSAHGPDERADESLILDVQRDPDGPAGRRAASELLGRYQQRIYVWCYRYARERERARDLAQEVLTRVWRGLPSYAGRSSFSWWVFVIARNRCLNAVRAPSLLRDEDAEPDDTADRAPGPEDELAMRDDEEATLRLLERTLDEPERMALWMGCFERMPVDEITRALGLTNATGARGLLQRARRKLRAALSARDEEAT